MSSKEFRTLKPVISVAFIILTLFSVVFLQMEERRLGYSLLKITREYRQTLESKKNREIQLAKATRPQWVEKVASTKFTLKKALASQIILLPNPLEDGEK
jgi:hypothetical protein